MKKTVIGIGGFIESGKTVAGKFFESLGAEFIDADEVVSHLYDKGGEGYRKIMSYFGEEFFKKNGELNKKKLAKFLFDDENKVKIINKLIHPIVTNEIQKLIDATEKEMIVIEATYFDPDQLGRIIDYMIWVDADVNVILKRGRNRDDMDFEMFKKVLDVQRKLKIRLETVDFVVKNNGDLRDFETSINEIWEKICRNTDY